MFALDILKQIIMRVGQENYALIKQKITTVAQMNISGKEKAAIVLKYAQSLVPGIASSALNYLIESIVQELKDKKIIA
jgi:hypothetical protein